MYSLRDITLSPKVNTGETAAANMMLNMLVTQCVEDNTTVQSKTAVEGKSQDIYMWEAMEVLGHPSTWMGQQVDSCRADTDETQIISPKCDIINPLLSSDNILDNVDLSGVRSSSKKDQDVTKALIKEYQQCIFQST